MVLKVLWFIWAALKRFLWACCLWLVLALLATPAHFTASERFELYLRTVAPDQRFDLAGWLVNAFVLKVGDKFGNEASRLSEADRKALVERYFRLAREEEEARGKLLQRRAALDSSEVLAALEKAVTDKREEKLSIERTTELIIAEMIEKSAQAEGLAYELPLNPQIILPPVAFKFVAPPLLLVMSPLDRIEQKKTLQLQPDLPLSRQEGIEGEVDKLNVVSLVVPIGGMGTYPTMVLETSSYEWTLEVVAHEWTHNYLDVRPLGSNYSTPGNSGAMRTINETVANIVGQELAYRARGLPPPTYEDEPEERPRPQQPPGKPGDFDYNREMRETYVQVSAMLKEGKVADAQVYMEERRKVFVQHGHALRKLNQAYFAFYGSYATGGGVGAANPIGGELKRLRRTSGDLRTFLEHISDVSNFEEYRALLRKLGVPEGKR